MTYHSHRKIIFTTVGLLVFTYLFSLLQIQVKLTIWSLFPPFLAIVLALFTKNVLFSLTLPLLTSLIWISFAGDQPASLAAFFANSSELILANLLDVGNLLILFFIFLMLINSTLMILSGAIHVLAERLTALAKGKKSAEFLIVSLGYLLFIDDYLNAIIVGTTMRPLADRFGISRAKFAFLVDATSAPVAGIALVSTWIGYEIGLLDTITSSLGMGKSGFALFLEALPFRFYCIFMIFFVLINILSGVDYGSMAKATASSDLNESETATSSNTLPRPGFFVSLLPLATLMLTLFVGLWFDGGGWEQPGRALQLNYWQEILNSAKNSKLIFIIAGAVSLVVNLSIIRHYQKQILHPLQSALQQGLSKAWLPVLILLLAWNFKSALDQLGTGKYILLHLSDLPWPEIFPALVFLLASVISFITGTSYGTMGILLPLALPLAWHLEQTQVAALSVLTTAAVLDGAIFGDHCSPISDTTVMSSFSCQCDHMEHVYTQLPYSLTVAFLSLTLGYLPAARGAHYLLSWFSTIVALLVLFSVITIVAKNRTKRQKKSSPFRAANPD